MNRIIPALCVLSLAACSTGPGATETTASQRTDALVQKHGAALLAGPNQRLEARTSLVDPNGDEHIRLERRYKGLRVLGGDAVLHVKANGETSASLTLREPLTLDESPAIDAPTATRTAERAFTGHDRGTTSAELIVFARVHPARLAWEAVQEGLAADQTPIELHVIVDAASGEILESWDGIETGATAGTGKTFFSGTVGLTVDSVTGGFALRDPSRGNLATYDMGNKQGGNGTLLTRTTSTFGNGLLTDSATIGADAQYGTVMTWDYYFNVHGRNGIANDGKGATNKVHYGRKYNNAYWSDSCFCMTYGDGDGTTFNPFTALDVAGHEMSHGVTSRTANLTYSGESGGLNEATSDIFGTMVEWYANNPVDVPDYLIGEKLYKSGTGALRYMYDPARDGVSAGCYSSTVGKLDVHYSSGVANHFFYLLAEGSSSPLTNTCGTGKTVTGVGRSAAERIWYRALTTYFTSGTGYSAARVATVSAATDLFGAGSAEVQAVKDAWDSVKVP